MKKVPEITLLKIIFGVLVSKKTVNCDFGSFFVRKKVSNRYHIFSKKQKIPKIRNIKFKIFRNVCWLRKDLLKNES